MIKSVPLSLGVAAILLFSEMPTAQANTLQPYLQQIGWGRNCQAHCSAKVESIYAQCRSLRKPKARALCWGYAAEEYGRCIVFC